MAGIGQQPAHLAADLPEHIDRQRRQRLLEGREILAGEAVQRRRAIEAGERGVDDDEVVGLGPLLERRDGVRQRLGIGLGTADLQRDQLGIVGRLKAPAMSRASSTCCFWSSPTGTCVAL